MIKLSLTHMHSLAYLKEGKCLSNEYVNNKTQLLWECKEGHQWQSRPNNVQQGQWCPTCSGNVTKGIKEMHEVAECRGGKCLSKEYVNRRTKLEWQCKKGHRWFAVPSDIIRGVWCPACAGNKPGTIEDMQKIAASRGGKCLSDKYVNKRTKLEWQCKEGHRWHAEPGNIKTHWCPDCRLYLGEAICKTTFEQIFNKKFNKVRPKWLRNSRGNQMELDGYCKELRIAFEYQGQQHFSQGFYAKTKEKLIRRKEDDKNKVKLCKKKGIELIHLSYQDNPEDLPLLIKHELESRDIDISRFNFNKKIDFNKSYCHKSKINEMREIAESRGGKCLSRKYISSEQYLLWRCSEGHVWKATPHGVKSGNWCNKCAGRKAYSIEEVHEIAKSYNIICLSKDYKNNKTRILWKCKERHEWYGTLKSILRNKSKCPYCMG
jgi:hypothetical protein